MSGRAVLRPEASAARALLVTVTALMVALGMLALALGVALRHVESRWRDALSDRWTLELPAETPADAAAQAAAAIRAIPGIRDAQPLDRASVEQLLAPWLGRSSALADLPLPVLVDVAVDAAAAPTPAVVLGAAQRIVAQAQMEDHEAWTRDLVRVAAIGEVLGIALFGAIIVAAMLAIIATARARLTINRAEIRLLHQLGASDSYIARQFQASALRNAALGAVLGTSIAAGAIAALGWAEGASSRFLPTLTLSPIDWAVLVGLPIAAIALATFTAGATAAALVRRLP